jgi:hypothetical protein
MSNNEVNMYNDENKYMMRSSLLFLVPGCYGVYCKEYTCSPLMILGSLISLNYWRKPCKGFRRNLDLYFVRSCVGIFGYKIFTSIKNYQNMFCVLGTYGLGKLCYFKACNEYYKKNKSWYKYHVSFHGFCSIGHSLILYYVL